jgi:hypothetical protein
MRVRLEHKVETRNMQTCMVILVTIITLFFFAGFVIVGAVLMSLDVSVTSQLVQQYNGYVMSWNDGIQTSFDGFTFKAQLGNYAQAPLQKMSIIDPTPNEKNVLTYIPLQYQTATNIPILTGEFKFNDASSIVTSLAIVYSWDVQKIQVNVPLFGIRKDVITGLSPQRRKKKFEVFNFLECDDSNGHFLPATSECQTYWVLSGICVLFENQEDRTSWNRFWMYSWTKWTISESMESGNIHQGGSRTSFSSETRTIEYSTTNQWILYVA